MKTAADHCGRQPDAVLRASEASLAKPLAPDLASNDAPPLVSTSVFKSCFVFNSKMKAFAYEDPQSGRSIRLSGVAELLKKTLFPHYDFTEVCVLQEKLKRERSDLGIDDASVVSGASLKEMLGDIPELRGSVMWKQQQSGDAFRGRTAGSRIDAECSGICNGDSAADIMKAAAEFGGGDSAPSMTYTPDLLRAYSAAFSRCGLPTALSHSSFIVRLHPYTSAVVAFLAQHDYVPVKGQVEVGTVKWGLGTAVDMLWQQQSSGKLLLVELKKWERGTYTIRQGNMKAPLLHVANCAHTHHQLQLAITRCLFMRTFAQFTRVHAPDGLVLCVHKLGIDVHPLEKWAEQVAPQLAARLQRLRKASKE
jgi:hypothetical protein